MNSRTKKNDPSYKLKALAETAHNIKTAFFWKTVQPGSNYLVVGMDSIELTALPLSITTEFVDALQEAINPIIEEYSTRLIDKVEYQARQIKSNLNEKGVLK